MPSVTLDVRSFHARGEEPFEAIMAAVQKVGPGDDFILINSFEPAPLYAVLGRQGFTHTAEMVGPDEWRIVFTRP